MAEQDVMARWVLAEQTALLTETCDSESDRDSTGSAGLEPQAHSGAVNPQMVDYSEGSIRRMLKIVPPDHKAVPVMFTGDHVRELRPKNWKTNPLGSGA